jgi:predicted O-methyltransferase YrrM
VRGRDVIDQVLSDAPATHTTWDASGAEIGTRVLETERACYEFLAERAAAGVSTLETGAGVSTVLFASLGTNHTCVTWSQDEVDRLVAYFQERGIRTSTISFEVGLSDEVLPRLVPEPLDIVFIDGGHGFPTPAVDWFYAGRRLRRGGVVVLDDVQLPAVALVVDFLDRDDRWERVAGTAKWAAFERRSEGNLSEDFWAQPFFVYPPPIGGIAGLARRVLRRARWH